MNSFLQQALAWVGGATVGGIGIVTIAYWLFQTWGEAWLQSKFNLQLEDLRHKQAQEIEALRYRVGQLLARSAKLSEKEFEVVPEAWQRLIDAYHTTLAHVSSAKRRPGLDRMDDEQLEEYLAETELYESQKQEIRNTDKVDRVRTYDRVIYWHEKYHVEQTAKAFSSYLAKYGIFISRKAAFASIEDMIWKALHEYAMYIEHNTTELDHVRRLEKEGRVLLKQIEADIHGALWKVSLDDDGAAQQ